MCVTDILLLINNDLNYIQCLCTMWYLQRSDATWYLDKTILIKRNRTSISLKKRSIMFTIQTYMLHLILEQLCICRDILISQYYYQYETNIEDNIEFFIKHPYDFLSSLINIDTSTFILIFPSFINAISLVLKVSLRIFTRYCDYCCTEYCISYLND